MRLPRCVSAAALLLVGGLLTARSAHFAAEDVANLPKATIDGNGPGWRALGEADFVNVNCADDTWTWKDGVIHCTGKPVGVMRTQEQVTNFELVVEWRHERPAATRASSCGCPRSRSKG